MTITPHTVPPARRYAATRAHRLAPGSPCAHITTERRVDDANVAGVIPARRQPIVSTALITATESSIDVTRDATTGRYRGNSIHRHASP